MENLCVCVCDHDRDRIPPPPPRPVPPQALPSYEASFGSGSELSPPITIYMGHAPGSGSSYEPGGSSWTELFGSVPALDAASTTASSQAAAYHRPVPTPSSPKRPSSRASRGSIMAAAARLRQVRFPKPYPPQKMKNKTPQSPPPQKNKKNKYPPQKRKKKQYPPPPQKSLALAALGLHHGSGCADETGACTHCCNYYSHLTTPNHTWLHSVTLVSNLQSSQSSQTYLQSPSNHLNQSHLSPIISLNNTCHSWVSPAHTSSLLGLTCSHLSHLITLGSHLLTLVIPCHS